MYLFIWLHRDESFVSISLNKYFFSSSHTFTHMHMPSADRIHLQMVRGLQSWGPAPPLAVGPRLLSTPRGHLQFLPAWSFHRAFQDTAAYFFKAWERVSRFARADASVTTGQAFVFSDIYVASPLSRRPRIAWSISTDLPPPLPCDVT